MPGLNSRQSARTTWSVGQRFLVIVLMLATAGLGLYDRKLLGLSLDLVLLGGFALVVAVKLVSILSGLIRHDLEDLSVAELALLDEESLPVYTILVPMYQEPGMVGPMVDSLSQLDYPQQKLDVQFLLEEDDQQTQAAVAMLTLPAWISTVIVSDGIPRTKPRACNFGLECARGEFLVIFDAEDRPDPDQLKKAVATFRRLPGVTCLQACLNYYNARQNLLTRWFTLEYTVWFDLFLPGLHSLGAPIPLGGTSNHFRTETLQNLGGWDAWNVTEDCDLGMHMARQSLETRVLNSTTWEEAVSCPAIWLRQRSRWVKGYWQTLLVHTRSPSHGIREFGIWQYLCLWLVIGGHVFALLMQPFCWLLLAVGAVRAEAIFHPSSPHTAYLYVAVVVLGTCNFLFMLVHAIGAWQRGMIRLVPAALGLPLYWALMSLAAWKGVLQHLWAPFYWEKTAHGLPHTTAKTTSAPTPAPANRSLRSRYLSLALILAAAVALVLGASYLPQHFEFEQQIQQAALHHDVPLGEVEFTVEENWLHNAKVKLVVEPLGQLADETTVFKAIVHLRDGDERWFQQHVSECVRQGKQITVTADLQQNWYPLKHDGQEFGPWSLRRVRTVGLKLFSHDHGINGVEIRDVSLEPDPAAPAPLAASVLSSFSTASQNVMAEARFTLSRVYKNPFDARAIDVAAEIQPPDGETTRAVAFYFQAYRATYPGDDELLFPVGPPEWRVRYTPRESGTYRWRLTGHDDRGGKVKTAWQTWEVAPSQARGFIQVDPDDHRYFSYENGEFFYPLGINLRSPIDNAQPRDRDYPLPSVNGGARAMTGYIDQMGASGINLARIWMAPWFGGIEWHKTVPGYHGIGQYNLRNAQQLDWIFERAAAHGIVVDLALQNHGPFASTYDRQWNENPYNSVHGGPLEDRRKVMTDPEAMRLFHQRFRYIAARWGADPTIFGWTTWIEVDAVGAKRVPTRAWHKEMHAVLRTYDTGQHPISTMYAGNFGDSGMWRMPEIDFTQIAAYAETNGAIDRFHEVTEYLRKFDKPAIIEEYGGSAIAGNVQEMSQHIHDGLWAGLMQRTAGAPYPWWWNLVFAKNLDRFHATAARFVAGTEMRGKEWHYGAVSLRKLDGIRDLRALYRHTDETAWAWIYEDAQTSLRSPEKLNRMDWRGILKAQTRQYKRFVGDRYHPATATEPDRFDLIADTSFTLTGLKPGRYNVEFWETWGSDEVSTTQLDVTDSGELVIALPPLQRDLALRISRMAP